MGVVLVRSFDTLAFPLQLFFFYLLLLLLHHLLLIPSTCNGRVVLCRPHERAGLLRFKDGLSVAGMISSWGEGEEEEDCCSWRGIGCDNRTGHVVELNLGSGIMDDHPLRGKIGSSLAVLKHLRHLDLSDNDFEGNSIPPFFGSFKRLTYLDLYGANFVGVVPQDLSNLSSLQVLTLTDIYRIECDGEWFSRLHKLRELNLRFNNLIGANNFLEVLNMLPFLETLRLFFGMDNCTLLSPSHVNFARLTYVMIDGNNFLSPCWLLNVTSLKNLYLLFDDIHVDVCPYDFTAKLCNLKSVSLSSRSGMRKRKDLSQFFTECNKRLNLKSLISRKSFFSGQLPGWLGEYKSLESLILSNNNLWGSIPESIGGMTSLTELDLSGNNLTGSIPQSVGGLLSLESLDLSGNNLTGYTPQFVGGLQSLQSLFLQDNNMSGPLPSSLGKLKSLRELDLGGNHFQGNLSEEHFVHLSNLSSLNLSSNSLLQVALSPHWVPPFNLINLGLQSCKVGPNFPLWLQTQNQLGVLDMSDGGISDVLPQWIWDFSSNLQYLDLSMNNLMGVVPAATNSSQMYYIIILHSNRLQGSLLSFPPVNTLLLSDNLFSGPINIDMSDIQELSLSNNGFIGGIPPSLCEAKGLKYLDLSHNRLSGQLPSCSADQKCGIASLHLNNNSLHGTIPTWLWSCTGMSLLDMGENNFSGGILNWISNSMLQLKVLRLRSNSFNGSIPMEMSKLTTLQVLDLADNNFSGSIPSTFGNFSAMKIPLLGNETLGYSNAAYYQESIMVASKGNYWTEPESILKLFTSIDLSGNKLSGDIPAEVGRLVYLRNLNLSHNHLHGCIPETLAMLSQLESLDLSSNNLSGGIPQILSVDLRFMSTFNVSFNNLSGRIPSGGQFDTYPNSSYTCNLDLCGKPLQIVCPGDLSPPIKGHTVQTEHQKDDHYYFLWLSVSIVLGFIMGFWTFLGTLFFKSNWRYTYFQFVDSQCEKYYQLAKTYVDKCRRMCPRS